MDPLHLWLMSGLFVAALAVLLPPVIPAPDELWPSEYGYLRRGTMGAVLITLAALHKDRLIKVGRNGIRWTTKHLPVGGDPFQRVVYHALHTATGPRSLATRRSVRTARAELVERLVGLGLVPGRGRRWLGRLVLVAVPVVALVGLTTGHTSALGFVIAVLATAVALRLSRCTVAGHVVNFTTRGNYKELRGRLDGVGYRTRGWYSATDYGLSGIDHSTPGG